MAQFLGDLAFLAELALVAAGLVLLHRARLEPPAGLLRLAGYVLLIGGIGAALCTGYYWFKYQAQGDFTAAYPAMQHEMPQAMQGRMQKMHQGMQGSDMHERMQKMREGMKDPDGQGGMQQMPEGMKDSGMRDDMQHRQDMQESMPGMEEGEAHEEHHPE